MSSNAPTLAGSWSEIGDPVRTMQDLSRAVRGSGTFAVRWGPRALARLAARVLGLPMPGDAVPVGLDVRPVPGGARWRRTFGSVTLETMQLVTSTGLLERYGPLELDLELLACGRTLVFEQRSAALRLGPFVLPLPPLLAPRVEGRATSCDDGRSVRADVTLMLPLIGTVLRYAGTMTIREVVA